MTIFGYLVDTFDIYKHLLKKFLDGSNNSEVNMTKD